VKARGRPAWILCAIALGWAIPHNASLGQQTDDPSYWPEPPDQSPTIITRDMMFPDEQPSCSGPAECAGGCDSGCDGGDARDSSRQYFHEPCRGEHFWVRGDYHLWWTSGPHLPPLVTASPPDTPRSEAGVLGLPNTSILFGGRDVHEDDRSGARITLGFWHDCRRIWGLEGDFWDMADESTAFAATGDGEPILTRPFYNVQAAQQDAELVSFPNVLAGTVSVHTRDYFQSAGIWLLRNLSCCEGGCGDSCGGDSCGGCGTAAFSHRVDLLAGYRYYRFNDRLAVREQLVAIDPIFEGTTFDIHDRFRADNEFHGGEIGLRSRCFFGCWSLEILGKLALGNNHQVVVINGSTTTAIPDLIPITEPGGLLTGQSNIDRYEVDQFTLVPQFGIELGCQLTCSLRGYIGYNLLYWAHVQRAADQIDFEVDQRNVPPLQSGGTPHPEPQLCNNDFWAQGLNFGLECRF